MPLIIRWFFWFFTRTKSSLLLESAAWTKWLLRTLSDWGKDASNDNAWCWKDRNWKCLGYLITKWIHEETLGEE